MLVFWKYLAVLLVGFVIGYFVKDNVSKPDQSIVNQNKIKQKGQNLILRFIQNRRLKKKI